MQENNQKKNLCYNVNLSVVNNLFSKKKTLFNFLFIVSSYSFAVWSQIFKISGHLLVRMTEFSWKYVRKSNPKWGSVPSWICQCFGYIFSQPGKNACTYWVIEWSNTHWINGRNSQVFHLRTDSQVSSCHGSTTVVKASVLKIDPKIPLFANNNSETSSVCKILCSTLLHEIRMDNLKW